VNSHPPQQRAPAIAQPDQNRAAASRAMPTITSDALFKGAHEIAIEHQGSVYRLRITRQGKLILNK
jgi:hemin uptake protein HemP